MSQKSKAVELLKQRLKDAGHKEHVHWEPEYKFHPDREWAFDIAFPQEFVAFEVEGGIYSHGRHVRPKGFIQDCEKYNEATIMGWMVFQIPAHLVGEGIAEGYLERLLG